MICIARIHNLGKPGNLNLSNSHACFEVKISLNKNNDNVHIERQNLGSKAPALSQLLKVRSQRLNVVSDIISFPGFHQ